MQPDNEILPVNRIKHDKYFSSKIVQKMTQAD